MSKTSKTKRHKERMAKKRALKATRRAQYAAWRDQGINKKSKRYALRVKRAATLRPIPKHRFGSCGNIGCQRCNPEVPRRAA